MLKLSRSALLLCLASVTALNSFACSSVQNSSKANQSASAASQAQSSTDSKAGKAVLTKAPQPTIAATPKARATQKNEAYQLALDKAQSAKSMSQSVQSAEDWNLVASRWQQAITLLKQVPKSDPNQKLARQRLVEYQRNLAIAQSRSTQTKKDRTVTLDPGISIDTPIAESLAAASAPKGTYRALIKYRQSRIPVIDVMFNGKRQYEMMVDTGASGTMITPDMAEELQAKFIGTTTAMTPAGPTEVEVGLIQSIQVGNHVIRNVPVLVGPVNLLGQDFFDKCDIAIKRDVVEFQQCSS